MTGVGQAEFRIAVLDPARPAPPGLHDPQGRPAGRRFDVYRNNVAASLSDALEVAFPVLRRLVGDEFFRAMAGVHLRAHPPRSPLMMFYGAEMPAFLAGFAPVAHLPYLPDIARLELALRESYHAADAPAIDAGTLAALPPDRLEGARLHLAPAVRLIRSAWPIHAIWRANTGTGGTGATIRPDAMRPEAVLIARPGLDPVVTVLPDAAADALAALIAGAPLGQAVAAGGDRLDLPALMSLLLSQAAICAID